MSKASGTKDGVHYSIQEITPQLAEEWLGRNTHNRHVSETKVAEYAGAIKRGEWGLNGEAISFDRDGKLLNGQHRLLAVLEAGKGIQSFVVRNLPPEAQETMDGGMKRGFHHVLQLRGYASAGQLASATRALYAYRHVRRFDAQGLGGGRGKFPAPTNQQLLNLVHRHPGLEESVTTVKQAREASPLKMPSGVAAFHYVVEEKFPEGTGDDFISKLVDFSYGGSGKNDPIVQLRKRWLEGQQSGGGRELRARNKMALMVKAFNAWMMGEEIPNLRWRAGGPAPEPFPEIVSPDEVS